MKVRSLVAQEAGLEFTPKTVLCLLDLSPASANVLHWTRLFAEKFGSEVQVLHIIWPPVPRTVTAEEGERLLEEYEERRVELYRSIRAQVDEVFGNRIRYDVAVGVGHPVKVVLGFIMQFRPELIVLGSHGHDGMARSLMGSVAENVVRESPFPTLIVKGTDLLPGEMTLTRLLCPVDLSGMGTQCLDASAGLARVFGTKLDVLRVLSDPAADVQGEMERLQQWVPEIVRERCPIVETVYSGETAEQIVMFARQHAVDLIVLGVEPHKFLEYTVLGRTTERVVRHGPCSVLLLRLEAASN